MTLTLPEGIGQTPVDIKKAEPDDIQLWSVTTLIGVLDKPALMFWSAEQTAIAAIESESVWKAMVKDRGQDEAVTWLRDARFRNPSGQLSAAKMGTVVHAACEEYALTGVRPTVGQIETYVCNEGGPKMPAESVKREATEAGVMLDQFDRWLAEWQPEYLAAECTVYDPDHGYAGTSDGFMVLAGTPVIFDYKTSREGFDKQGKPTGPYPEAGLQLAAYRYAKYAAIWRPRRVELNRRRYYLLGITERELAVPVPAVEGGIVIHITPDHCTAVPVRCDEAVHRCFLYIIEAAKWQFEMAPQVVGLPMVKM